MPKLKCDWDCCKHYNTETGYCDNPDEVELSTVVVDDKELFDCKSFEDFDESEG